MAVKKPLTVSQSDDVSMTIETVTGRLINPTNPDHSQIDIHDIAWATSRMPRFAGHSITATPYNVAQHSIYVSELVKKLLEFTATTNELAMSHATAEVIDALTQLTPDEDAYLPVLALLHDAHEAYTGDIPSPIKRIPELTETLKLIEGKLDHAIRSRFALPEPSAQVKIIIKFCDKLAQAIEGYQFMPSRGKNWNLPKPSLTLIQEFPEPLTPLESYTAFIKQFDNLLP